MLRQGRYICAMTVHPMVPDAVEGVDPPGTAVVGLGPDGLARARDRLLAGALVAFPTETVYGLGADATNDRAVAAVFAAKGRPRFNPLIVHVADVEAARAVAVFDARADRAAESLWPGPLTLVLPRRADAAVSRLATAGLDTVAVRVPSHPAARALLAAVGRPVVAPSANPSGAVSPTTARHVLDGLAGRIALVLAGGRCTVGLESTVLDLTGPAARLLRPGAVGADRLAELGGPVEAAGDDAAGPDGPRPVSPGRLASHYAPAVPVRPDAAVAAPGEAWLGFGPELRPGPAVASLNLSETGDLEEAAANLFAMLRALDRSDVSAIAVAPVPETGLGIAINDRLRRAAAPRPSATAPGDGHPGDAGPAAG